MNRRQFIKSAVVAAGALPLPSLTAAEAPQGAAWPIGCFNRPWINNKLGWTYDTALDGIKAAGYKLTGLLTPSAHNPFIAAEATPEYLAGLKQKIAARGLTANMGALHLKEKEPVADQIQDIRKQLDNAKFLGLEFALTFGVNGAEHYENYYKVMQDAAAYAQDHGIKLVLKPHGGASGAAEEIIRCMSQVKHPNFKIWFDAGNIIYYTGKDPVEQLKPIAERVTGFCAKDCARQRGEIWLDFGTGKVDFHAVFATLKRAGFNGPVMVECCQQGPTPGDVTAGARRNREYLEKLFASL